MTRELFAPEILNDWLIFALHKKAEVVHLKCIRAGKIEIARRIASKYGLNLNHDDTVMALKMALFASKNRIYRL